MAGDTVIRNGKATITMTGFGDLYARLRKISPRVQQVGVAVLDRGASRVFGQSQNEVPVSPEDGGQLKASGRLNKARVSPRSGRVYATITYGGARLAKLAPNDSPIYALIIHEHLGLKHTHGSAKYLERPYNANKAAIMEDLRQSLAREVNSGFA